MPSADLALPAPSALSDTARFYAAASLSPHTRRAYASQWRLWLAWCAKSGQSAMPANPDAVANWIAERARPVSEVDDTGAALQTLRTALSAVRSAHLVAGQPFDTRTPIIVIVLAGIARQHPGTTKQAAPLRADILSDIIGGLGESARDRRDAALLALGYSFGLRRSELAGLDFGGSSGGLGVLIKTPQTMEIRLLRSKGHRAKAAKVLVVPRTNNAMAFDAVDRWLQLGEVALCQPLLRRVNKAGRVSQMRLDSQSVSLIIKRRIAEHLRSQNVADCDADIAAQSFSGHSLRVGYAVTAAEAGADILAIQAALGHAGPAMSSRYAEAARLSRTSPLTIAGVALHFRRRQGRVASARSETRRPK